METSKAVPCYYSGVRSAYVHSMQNGQAGIATGYGLDDGLSGFDFRLGLGFFLFDTISRPALGPTQPPIQVVPGVISLGVKLLGREADHSPPSSAEVKE